MEGEKGGEGVVYWVVAFVLFVEVMVWDARLGAV